MPIKAVLFDLDNTLWDFTGNAKKALTDLYVKHLLVVKTGLSTQEFLETYDYINKDYWIKYEKGEVDKETLRTRRFVDTLKIMGVPEFEQPPNLWEEYLDICPRIPSVLPGAMEALQFLKNKVKVGIITNGFEETQLLKMDCSGIAPYVDLMVSSEAFGTPKPNAAIFNFTVEKLFLEKEDCVYIGDNLLTDVVGGMEAGINTAWLTNELEIPEYVIKNNLFIGAFSNLTDFINHLKW